MADTAEKPTNVDVEATPANQTETATPAKEEIEVAEAADEKTQKKTGAPVVAADDAAEHNGETSKRERSIIRQVEYYFGDANLNRDKFLLEQISKDKDGWVPLSVLLTFKRLADLSGGDQEAIVSALQKSDEGLVEVSEDKEKVRRHPERPIPEHNEERRKDIQSRTAYAKGFPLDVDISELLEYFNNFESVANVNMRKYLDKPTKTYKFKGSVFVTFEKKEQAQEFIEKDKVLFKERELIRKWQEKYLEEKKEEQKAKAKKKEKSKPAEEDKFTLPKGTVLFFDGATDVVTRELLREAIEKVPGEFELAFIDYSKGEKTGHIRFTEENVAAKFLEKLEDKKLKLNEDISLELRTLTEEEETAFLAKAIEHMKNRRSHQNRHKGGFGNRKRRGGNDNRHDHKKKRAAK